MKFRTEFVVSKCPVTLNPGKPVVMAGSCFTQNISGKMNECSWETINPFGTLYNPSSIAIALEIMTDEEEGVAIFEKSLFLYNGIWNSHYFDSSFSSMRREDCIEEFHIRRKKLKEALIKGGVMIVTFGTSICHYLTSNNDLVGNCHKQPSFLFYTRRLTCQDICKVWNDLISKLRSKFSDIKIIFTVSPVRHLKNGFTGNILSKSILLLSVEEICETNPDCFYFPAYEILNDDLRDYRFYGSDLVHPSSEGIDYIWEKFKETFLDSDGMKLLEDGLKRYRTIMHRPLTGALGKILHTMGGGSKK